MIYVYDVWLYSPVYKLLYSDYFLFISFECHLTRDRLLINVIYVCSITSLIINIDFSLTIEFFCVKHWNIYPPEI